MALLLGVIALGAAACGGSEEGPKQLPATPEEAGSLVIRVSGTEGVAYKGRYGPFPEEGEVVEETTMGAEPVEYEVANLQEDGGGLLAVFRKTKPGTEQLKVQIVADGEVAVEESTYVEKGSVSVDWGIKPPRLSELEMPELPPPPPEPEMPEFEPPPEPEMPELPPPPEP